MQRDLANMEYEFLPTINFTLHERGKLRRITGEQVQDRIVKHALCDEVLNPLIEPHLIYDNGASIVGKGIDFTRRRLLTHLRKYYAQHGSKRTYASVPAVLKEQVKEMLIDLELEDLITE